MKTLSTCVMDEVPYEPFAQCGNISRTMSYWNVGGCSSSCTGTKKAPAWRQAGAVMIVAKRSISG